MAHYMAQIQNKAVVPIIGHFDNEINMVGLEKYPGIKMTEIKPSGRKISFLRHQQKTIIMHLCSQSRNFF